MTRRIAGSPTVPYEAHANKSISRTTMFEYFLGFQAMWSITEKREQTALVHAKKDAWVFVVQLQKIMDILSQFARIILFNTKGHTTC